MDKSIESAWMSWSEFGRAIENKQVIFFGVSDDWTEKTIRRSAPNLVYIVDNSRSWIGSQWNGVDIKSPEILKQNQRSEFVVITSSSYESIIPQLLEYGLVPGIDFCITPALNDLKVITDIHSHDARLLISSPDHKLYAGFSESIGLDRGKAGLGGIYLYDVKDEHCEKVIDGTFHQIVDTGTCYYVAEENRGVCKISKQFELIDSFGQQPGMKPHGIAYWPERNIVFLGNTSFDKVSAFDENTHELLFEISLSAKWEKDGRPHHWLNDLCVWDGYLYISMFSHSGADGHGVYDGGILQVDLEDHNNRYVLVNDAWMPHTVRFIDSQICYLDSMNWYLYRSTKNIIGEFPPFARGLAYDGTYYYVGQSEVRNFAPLKGIKKLIGMTAGFYMFDDETKAAKFFNVPGVRQIHDLCIVKE